MNTEQKHDDDEDEQPEAVPILQSVSGIEEEKEVDIKELFARSSKEHPGAYFKDKFPDNVDPRGEPTFIEFKWNPKFEEMKDCDTIHMLYLLQCACELHRLRVIERNKYFESISRADRYISHVDAPQIITNFIEWHDKDKEKNVFTGEMMESKDKMFMINDMLSTIGM